MLVQDLPEKFSKVNFYIDPEDDFRVDLAYIKNYSDFDQK